MSVWFMKLFVSRVRERERDVGIICVIKYDDLALEACTQSEREREREREKSVRE